MESLNLVLAAVVVAVVVVAAAAVVVVVLLSTQAIFPSPISRIVVAWSYQCCLKSMSLRQAGLRAQIILLHVNESVLYLSVEKIRGESIRA